MSARPCHHGKRGNFTPRKLTDDQVRLIRADLEARCGHCGGRDTYRQIGERYGVSAVTIHKIATGKSRVAA
ncbi:MAG: hypothetical protein I8H86_06240 [Sphingomonadaceae bacterium]|nr:hypothetical protein [Sphingomonadaceae bacterium]